uniref:Uncharacterized protein n=1 Tax=Acrobeloides nanus TaxID=290746 RepID=A0A914E0T0_9BILA
MMQKKICGCMCLNSLMDSEASSTFSYLHSCHIRKSTFFYNPLVFLKSRKSSNSNDRDEDSKRFITSYEDRQLPVRVIDQGKSRGIEWQIDPNTLKLNEARELLKIFASGLFIEKQPYNFIAVCGFQDLLKTNFGPQILAQTLVDIIPFVRKGLDSKSISKRTEMLSLIQQMASNGCGPLLVPFYRMLLPPLRKTSSRNRTSISTDISTTEWDRYLHAVDKTLSMLEESGGPNAYINIKYIIPCYYPTR